MNTLRDFIALIIEADVRDLVSINASALKKRKFSGEPRELQRQAHEGPIFSARTLRLISLVKTFPLHNKKQYIKWLANECENGAFSGWHLSDEIEINGINHELSFLVDFIDANGIDFENENYHGVVTAAYEWHNELADAANDELQIESTDAVYTWPDGWKIATVPPEQCSAEGEAMGHCVGSYRQKLNNGEKRIYSLRDSNNRPHVTIEISHAAPWAEHPNFKDYPLEVRQIKGKGNSIPVPKYAKRILEWLRQTNIQYKKSEDFIDMVKNEDGTAVSGLEDAFH